MSLPTGTLTFLFTDIEGSTKLWEAHPEAMRLAVARHDALLQQAVGDNDGHVFKATGDGVAAAFALAPDALAAALAAQQALLAEPWPEQTPLRSRIGLHTGAAELRNGDYFGPALNRCARLMAAGHGGQTLLSDAAYELVRDALVPDVSLTPLGEHRLKDLARPETIYQAQHPSLRAEFPPLRTLDNPDTPNNLPQQVTSFVGREKQLAEVAARLDKTRLLTLTGAGGSGKTRLALQAAADVLERHPQGVWLVELAPLADPTLVPQTIAVVLGIREQAGQSLTQTLTEVLKNKKLILLLDNCEHLISACGQIVTSLMRACPKVTVLATSREALGIGGEQVYRVPSLTLPDPKVSKTATPEILTQFESVRLFIERAQAVRSEFSVTNQNAPSLAQLCFRLDGIPLAIELAAARVRSLTVEQINDKLDSRFRLLTGGDRSALPRQQTLRALIDWSYDLLTPREKTLLARLSLFAGGWTLEASESVCGWEPVEDWEVLDLLTSLADKSLILSEETAGEQATRYRMLETIRQYAAERLSASDEEAMVRERHVDFFVTLAEEAAPKLTGPDQVDWLNRLETEHDNVRAALDSGYGSGGPEPSASVLTARTASLALSGLRLSGVMAEFWRVRGYASEGREHLARALAGRQAVESGPADASHREEVKQVLATALYGAGLLSSTQGDYAEALTSFAESLAFFRGLGNKRGIANVLHSLGIVAYSQGDYAAARSLYEESLALSREIGNKLGIANALYSLGIVAYSQGDYAAARSLYEESLVLYREIGSKLGIAYALCSLGNVAHIQGDYAAALTSFAESLAFFRGIGNKLGIANVLNGLGDVAYSQGDYAAARSLQEECLALNRQIGNKLGIASVLNGLGDVAYCQGDYAAARSLQEECLALNREIGSKLGIASVLYRLGYVANSQGDYAAALTSFAESLAFFRGLGSKHGVANALNGLARAYASSEGGSRLRLAVVLWAAADTLRESIGLRYDPQDQEALDAAMAQGRAALDDEAAWTAAWDEGAALPWEAAVKLALGE